MKLFLDSANLEELESALKKGCITGVTTNPSILSREPQTDFFAHIGKMAALCKRYEQLLPLSVEVFTEDPQKMLDQAHALCDRVDYENLNIKIPIGWDELEVIHKLSTEGIAVNCTCIFTEAQSTLAANAGATYLSIFWGRLRDIGGDPVAVIEQVRHALDSTKAQAEIIVGSVRHPKEVSEAHTAGGHIVTAPLSLYEKMAAHPQTEKSVAGFLADFREWIEVEA